MISIRTRKINVARDYWTEQNVKCLLSERFIANRFRNSGYQVTKISKYDPKTEESVVDKSTLRKVLKGHPEKKRLIDFLSTVGVGLPDFICRKGMHIHFAEVKSGSSKLKEHQKRVHKSLIDMGYQVSTNRIRVAYHVEEMICNHAIFEVDARLTDYVSS